MINVYPDAIVHLFGPLVGLADEGMDLDASLRPPIVTEQVVKQIYESELRPHFESLDARLQNAYKLSLRYILNATDFNYRNEFYSLLPPFECPEENPKLAFLWLWEVLFPNEQPLPLSEPFEIIHHVNVSRHILEGY
jgi:hypothetical protein